MSLSTSNSTSLLPILPPSSSKLTPTGTPTPPPAANIAAKDTFAHPPSSRCSPSREQEKPRGREEGRQGGELNTHAYTCPSTNGAGMKPAEEVERSGGVRAKSVASAWAIASERCYLSYLWRILLPDLVIRKFRVPDRKNKWAAMNQASGSSTRGERLLCIGCNTFEYTSPDSRSYHNHKRKCGKKIAAATAKLLQIRRDNIQAVKARRKGVGSSTQEVPIAWQYEPGSRDSEIGSEIGSCEKMESEECAEGEEEEMHEEPEILPAIPELRPSGRPNRLIRLPARYRDEMPPQPPLLLPAPSTFEPDPEPIPSAALPKATETLQSYVSELDSYGMFREYPFGRPLHNPDEHTLISDLVESSTILRVDSSTSRKWFSPLGSSKLAEASVAGKHADKILPSTSFSFAPFLNPSVFRLMTWFYNSSAIKSYGQLNSLVNNVILAPDFKQEHFVGFSAVREAKRMDDHISASSSSISQPLESTDSTDLTPPLLAEDGWLEASVFISAPCDGVCQPENQAPRLEIKGLHYRRLIPVIKAAFSEPNAQKYHTTPFRSYWYPENDDVKERIYHENYCADFYLRDYEHILGSLPEGSPEPIIASLMAYSDSTHLANFGTASLWPVYLFLGNQSKYERGQPSSFAAHHVAYIPKIKDTVQEFYLEHYGTQATRQIMTYLRRELMQEVWMLLLDDEFVEAYVHGTKIEFPENKERLLFPRFNTYEMDYPENLPVVNGRGNPWINIDRLGTAQDMRNRVKLARVDNQYEQYDRASARSKIFDQGLGPESAGVLRILDATGLKGWTPTRSAFSRRLFDHGFNYYKLFAPDLMHEFELGVWKYRQTPTFGRDTIRRFSTNVSGLKKLAARDFEDILQCSLPVFDGLFPPKHDHIIVKLLFELCTWHGLAKLRLHTETTLDDLENSTTRLGEALREFAIKVCPDYNTKELPSEEAVRLKRQAAAAAKKRHVDLKKAQAVKQSKGRQRKNFNMHTYKLHGLGGYVRSIRDRGTTDGTSTQMGELEHRRVKRFYCRGIQHKDAIAAGIKTKKRRAIINEELPPLSPENHHQISCETRNKINLDNYILEHEDDPAVKDFYIKLKNHLLSQLLAKDDTANLDQFSPLERAMVTIINDNIFEHHVLRVNYTTYDLRRDQDSINPRTHPDVQLLASKAPGIDVTSQHPYLYARVLGVFHAKVVHHGPLSMSRFPQHLEFLLVRWFEFDETYRGGWKGKRLHRIRFVPQSSNSFGFVNPLQIVRGIHIIPAFREGRTADLLQPSPIARQMVELNVDNADTTDWAYYHVAMFSDCDYVMRYRGGGVGHKAVRKATNFFKTDRGVLDQKRRFSKQQAANSEAVPEQEDADEDDLPEGVAAMQMLDNNEEEELEGDNVAMSEVDSDEGNPLEWDTTSDESESEEEDTADLMEQDDPGFDDDPGHDAMSALGYGTF
ncbi:hypothetical protein CPC08DRAFT_730863 [Agrocybe pediades]|nr:hypothetical protein CPC08DRAFT_730863 [Agrocybe pediades]